MGEFESQVRRCGTEHAIDHRTEQQRDETGGRADTGHQHHGGRDQEPVFFRVTDQTAPDVHTGTLRRSMAAVTRSMATLSMGPSALTTSPEVPQGPQIAGSERPKMTTGGTPNAAAMCAGPESLPMKSA